MVLKAQGTMLSRCTDMLKECSRRTRLYTMMLSPPLTASDGEVFFTALQNTLMHVLEIVLSPDVSLVVGQQQAKSVLEDLYEKRLDEYNAKKTSLLKPGSGVDRSQIDELLPPNPRVNYGGDEKLKHLLTEVLDVRQNSAQSIYKKIEDAIDELRSVARNDLERQQCGTLEALLYGRKSRVPL